MTVAIIICSTVVVVTSLVLWSAMRMAKIQEEKEEALWRTYCMTVLKDAMAEETRTSGPSGETSATTESASKTATDATE